METAKGDRREKGGDERKRKEKKNVQEHTNRRLWINRSKDFEIDRQGKKEFVEIRKPQKWSWN